MHTELFSLQKYYKNKIKHQPIRMQSIEIVRIYDGNIVQLLFVWVSMPMQKWLQPFAFRL